MLKRILFIQGAFFYCERCKIKLLFFIREIFFIKRFSF